MDDMNKMAVTAKGLRIFLAGLVVMISGYVLMAGGRSDNPEIFSYAIFNSVRIVAAPILIVAGIVVEIAAIMGFGKEEEDKK